MRPATYRTVTRKYLQRPSRPPQAATVPLNAAEAKVIWYIQHHTAHVDQWCQIVNTEDILKQQLLESLDKKYFKGQHQAYINYANCTLSGLIQNLYNDNGTISPMDIEEVEQNMNQEWSLLYKIV